MLNLEDYLVLATPKNYRLMKKTALSRAHENFQTFSYFENLREYLFYANLRFARRKIIACCATHTEEYSSRHDQMSKSEASGKSLPVGQNP